MLQSIIVSPRQAYFSQITWENIDHSDTSRQFFLHNDTFNMCMILIFCTYIKLENCF